MAASVDHRPRPPNFCGAPRRVKLAVLHTRLSAARTPSSYAARDSFLVLVDDLFSVAPHHGRAADGDGAHHRCPMPHLRVGGCPPCTDLVLCASGSPIMSVPHHCAETGFVPCRANLRAVSVHHDAPRSRSPATVADLVEGPRRAYQLPTSADGRDLPQASIVAVDADAAQLARFFLSNFCRPRARIPFAVDHLQQRYRRVIIARCPYSKRATGAGIKGNFG